MSVDPMTPEEESEILVRLAQRYAPGHLPEGVALSEASLPELTSAIKAGMAASRQAQPEAEAG